MIPSISLKSDSLTTSSTVGLEAHSDPKHTTRSGPDGVSVQNQNNPAQGYGALAASLAALVAYGWFYRQLKDGKQPGNLPAAIMYTANDSTLLVAALLTPGQGWSTRIVYGIFVGVGVLISRHLLSVAKREAGAEHEGRSSSLWSSFSTLEKRCCVASSVGIAAMVASNVPLIASQVPQSLLVMFGALTGVVVTAVASVPLMKTMWTPTPQSDHAQLDPGSSHVPLTQRVKETVRPILPYSLGTLSLVTSALMVEKFSFQTLLSPVGMCAINLLLTASVGVWAWRRAGQGKREES